MPVLFILIAYLLLCLLMGVFIPSVTYMWNTFYEDIIKRSIKDIAAFNFKKVSHYSYLIFAPIIAVIALILLLLTPFILYWLNRSYKNSKRDTILKVESPKPINQEYIIPPISLSVNKKIPFTPDSKQVIYIESSYNKEVNNYIVKRYAEICDLFKKAGYYFIYIPKEIETIDIENVTYLFPHLDKETISLNQSTSQAIVDDFLSYSDDSLSLSGGLLRLKEETEDNIIFRYYKFVNYEEEEIWEQLRAYISRLGDSPYPLYSINIKPEDNADFFFDSKAKQLIEEIKERIESLKKIGINEMVLKSLLSIEVKPQISKLIITKDYKIILPDYNNMEIIMYPLPKAVFLLFLKHPEGILFKHLSDYRGELIDLYKMVATKGDMNDFEKSIDDIIDPTKNAINEKCARIRESFIKKIDESIAQNYFITGERATPKKIILDRNLLEIEVYI